MTPDLPRQDDASTREGPKDGPRDAPPPETLETFEIDVTAGNSARLESTSPLDSQASADDQIVERPLSNRTSDPTGAEVPEGILVGQFESTADVAENAASMPIVLEPADGETQSGNVVRRVARESRGWLTSLTAHIVVLAILALTSLVIPQKEELELYAFAPAYEPVEDFEDFEIDPSEELDTLDEMLSEPDPAPLEDLLSDTLIEEPAIAEAPTNASPPAELSTDLSELSDLFGESAAGLTGMDSAVGEGTGAGMAKFFGTEVKARRILYMLDNSGGMRKDGKFEALVSELKRSVSGLDAKQEFYVIFYSDTVYPLFYPQGVRKFVRSNDRNRKMLDRWLASVELCVGNAIDEALAAADVIRPEAVFLLTDGDLFTTQKKKNLLLNPTGRSYAIHTFGLGVGENSKTAEGLKQVAQANTGTFRAIEVTAAMEELARETERPYHNKRPGTVWGIKVGKR